MKIVLICGSRKYKDKQKIFDAIMADRPDAIVEGKATGADSLAGECAEQLGIPHIQIGANWKVYGKSAGPLRNGWMIQFVQVTEVWAFPLADSRGTWNMVEQAKAAGIPVRVYPA